MERTPTSAETMRRAQLASLNELLKAVVPANPFYTKKVLAADLPGRFSSFQEFTRVFPFTTKSDIAQDQLNHPPYGRNLTFPIDDYSRLHQTSGTTGQPLRWLDTPQTWDMLVDCWTEVYRAAGVTHRDVCYFAFSFGPFIGFWLAFDAGSRIGCLCIPSGGQTSLARLQAILDL